MTRHFQEAQAAQDRFFRGPAGLRLHLADWGGVSLSRGRTRGGSGLRVLLLHGLGGHVHWWDPVAPLLSARHAAAALDFRGHGDSAWAESPAYQVADHAADIEAARVSLGWDRFSLAAHSFGARVALEYAALEPSRLERLALLDFMPEVQAWDPGRFKLAARARQPSYSSLEELARRFHLQPDGTSAEPGLIEEVARASGRRREDGRWTWKFDWRGFGVQYPPCWKLLPGLKMPCLVVRGEFSSVMTREDLKRVVNALPAGMGAEIPGAHHHVTLDAPGRVAELLLDFLGA